MPDHAQGLFMPQTSIAARARIQREQRRLEDHAVWVQPASRCLPWTKRADQIQDAEEGVPAQRSISSRKTGSCSSSSSSTSLRNVGPLGLGRGRRHQAGSPANGKQVRPLQRAPPLLRYVNRRRTTLRQQALASRGLGCGDLQLARFQDFRVSARPGSQMSQLVKASLCAESGSRR